MLKNFSQFIGVSPTFEQISLLDLATPSIKIMPGDTAREIKIRVTDPGTGKPLALKYNIAGEYSFFDFDLELRNVSRLLNGALDAEAKPTNSAIAATLKKVVPADALTKDGWLRIEVPANKINQAIAQLKQNRWQTAEVDAGYGVTISLTRVA